MRDDVKKTRFHDFVVTVPGGAKAARVRQTSHDYNFGSNIFPLVRQGGEWPEREKYQQAVDRLWNFGTLPFYWGRY
ncbi:MAG: hypothetical protein ACOC0O_01180, partial [Spirochaetota bacterium]